MTRDSSSAEAPRIGSIDVVVEEVFDQANPQENHAPYRAANALHYATREIAKAGIGPVAPIRSADRIRKYAPALDMILDHVVDLFLANGFPRKLMARQLALQVQSVRRGVERIRVREMADFEFGQQFSVLLHLWFNEAQYVDEHRDPRPIRLRGKAPSVEQLLRRSLPRSQVLPTLIWLQREKLLPLNRRGLCIPPHSQVLLMGGRSC